MLINLTNHPSTLWSDDQKQAAKQFGKCIDLQFPAIDPDADMQYVDALADEYLQKIKEMAQNEESTPVVHLMGEMTFLFALAAKLKDNGVRCVASTTKRNTIDRGNGQKQTEFQFVRFRDYYILD